MIVPAIHIMPFIRDSLNRGQRVNMSATGSSMTPFIFDGDEVELVPLNFTSSDSEKLTTDSALPFSVNLESLNEPKSITNSALNTVLTFVENPSSELARVRIENPMPVTISKYVENPVSEPAPVSITNSALNTVLAFGEIPASEPAQPVTISKYVENPASEPAPVRIENPSSHVALSRGDIVLAQSALGHYVLHRIARVESDMLFLRGDSQTLCDGPYDIKNILGKVTTSIHNGNKRRHDRGFWRMCGLFWVKFPIICLSLYSLSTHLRRFTLRLLRAFKKFIIFPLSQ